MYNEPEAVRVVVLRVLPTELAIEKMLYAKENEIKIK